MEVEKVIYLDEEDLENIRKIKNMLIALGLDKLYGEKHLYSVAYELSFSSVFDDIISVIQKSKSFYEYSVEGKSKLLIIKEGSMEFKFDKDNRILIEGRKYKNSNPNHPDFTKITIDLWASSEKLYYDSKVFEEYELRNYIKTTNHIVRLQGKSIFISSPVYGVSEVEIPLLKRQKGKLNESLLYR